MAKTTGAELSEISFYRILIMFRFYFYFWHRIGSDTCHIVRAINLNNERILVIRRYWICFVLRSSSTVVDRLWKRLLSHPRENLLWALCCCFSFKHRIWITSQTRTKFPLAYKRNTVYVPCPLCPGALPYSTYQTVRAATVVFFFCVAQSSLICMIRTLFWDLHYLDFGRALWVVGRRRAVATDRQ